VQQALHSVAAVLSHSSYSASLNPIAAKAIVILMMSAEQSATSYAIFFVCDGKM
jgi:hypothetical protein